MKTVEQTRRELFESLASKDHIDHDGIFYENPYVESAWNGFSAALDAVVIELPFKVGDDTEYDDGYLNSIDECRAAIESTNLGLKIR